MSDINAQNGVEGLNEFTIYADEQSPEQLAEAMAAVREAIVALLDKALADDKPFAFYVLNGVEEKTDPDTGRTVALDINTTMVGKASFMDRTNIARAEHLELQKLAIAELAKENPELAAMLAMGAGLNADGVVEIGGDGDPRVADFDSDGGQAAIGAAHVEDTK